MKIPILFLLSISLVLTSCVQSTNPIYGDNYGKFINQVSGKVWEIYIDGLEREQMILSVYFKPNQKVKYKVIHGSNKGYIFDDGKDRWRVYNENLYISFNDGKVNLRGKISEKGLTVEGNWKDNKWERIPWLKYFPKKGEWSGLNEDILKVDTDKVVEELINEGKLIPKESN